MLRQDLLNVLKLVKGALGGSKSMIPIHPCFCFTGTEVFSFDDTAALVTKLATPWKGGVRGEELLQWLEACGGKEVEIEMDGSTLKLKCGRAHAELPVLAESEFLFSPPDVSKAPKIRLTAAVMGALRRASLAMGVDGQHPWRCGIQATLLESEATFFGCDEASAARAWAESKAPKSLHGKSILLPPRFVDLVRKMAGEGDLWVTDDWFAASVDTGVTLFSAVPGDSSPKTFDELFAGTSEIRKQAVPLPKTWWGALKRASVLLAGEKEAPATCRIVSGKMEMTALSSYGNSRDTFKLEGAHPDVEARLPPAIALKPGADESKLVSSFFIAEGPKFYFGGERFDFFVASGS